MIGVGTSGWQYRDWRGAFYPARLAQARWLEHYATAFQTVELNSPFYRLPERATFEKWRAGTPEDFCFAVKMSRYLTHIKRLRDPAEPVARFLDRAGALGPKLGPVLLQLPPTLTVDVDLLSGVLSRFPPEVRVAVEPRHPSWWVDPVRSTLVKHGAALCWSDRGGRPQAPLWTTSDWGYLRLHEGRANPRPRYGRSALRSWVERIDHAFYGEAPVYVYFNNDPGCAAVADASVFARLAARTGRSVSRTGGQR